MAWRAVLVLALASVLVAGNGAAQRADRWGDPLPEGAIQRLGTLRLVYPEGISDFCYLPDGQAAVASGNAIDIWDTATGSVKERQELSEGRIQRMAPKPGSEGTRPVLLLTLSDEVCEWDLAEGRELKRWACGQKGLALARYSPCGERAITVGTVPPTLKEWEVASGKELRAIEGGTDCFSDAVYGAEGKTVWVGGGHGHVLEEYDLTSGKCLQSLFDDYIVYDMTVSPDGERMLVGSRHRGSEWVMAKAEKLREFSGHHGHAVPAVAYTVDGAQILTGSRDGSIRRWDRNTGEILLRWFPHQEHVSAMRVSPDGKWVLSRSGGKLVESALDTGQARINWGRHDGDVNDVALMADGCHVVSASSDGTLRVWDSWRGVTDRVIEGANLGAYAVAVSPDGERLAAGCKDGVVREFDAETGGLVRALEGHRGYVRSVAYGPEGSRLFSSADDGCILAWNREGAEPCGRLEGHLGGVLSIDVSPEGGRLVSGGRDCSVRVWDLAEYKPVAAFEDAHCGWVEVVRFAKGGKQAFSGGRDGWILRWNLDKGTVANALHQDGWIRDLVVSPKGTWVFSGAADGSITCWNTRSGRETARLEGHKGAVTGLALTPDERRLVSASADTTLLVWWMNEDTGRPFQGTASKRACGCD